MRISFKYLSKYCQYRKHHQHCSGVFGLELTSNTTTHRLPLGMLELARSADSNDYTLARHCHSPPGTVVLNHSLQWRAMIPWILVTAVTLRQGWSQVKRRSMCNCHFPPWMGRLSYSAYSISQEICTQFLLCCALMWLYIDWFSHIHKAHFTGAVAI